MTCRNRTPREVDLQGAPVGAYYDAKRTGVVTSPERALRHVPAPAARSRKAPKKAAKPARSRKAPKKGRRR
ncbi:MAG TPA: hypothetical protein VNG33_23570 [Polyangiaceae bacterium]|nr:hypothetical protein [Polyangiaceae bacterium]